MNQHDPDALALFFGAPFAVVGLLLLGGDPAGGSVSLVWAGPAVAIVVALIVVLATWPLRRPTGGDDETGEPQ